MDAEYSHEEAGPKELPACIPINFFPRGRVADKTVRVLARVVALPEKIEEVESILRILVTETRKEVGCVQYELLQNRDDASEFTFIEEWISDSAIDAHFAASHVQAAFSKAAHLLAREPDIRRYLVVK